ncbi:MAG: hypothetical protein R6X14_01345 [bacterium]
MLNARCLFAAALMLTVPAAARPLLRAADLTLGLRHEPGVETRLPLALSATLAPLPSLRASGALGFNLARPPLPDRFALETGWTPLPRLELAAGTVLRRWPAWRAGENTAFLSARVEALPRLALEAGIARRVPLLDTTGWWLPFAWGGALAEWNLVYGIGWQVVDRPGFGLRVETGNCEPLAIRTPDLLNLVVRAEKRLRPGLTGIARLAGEAKGFSSVLAAFGAVELEIGVRHEF